MVIDPETNGRLVQWRGFSPPRWTPGGRLFLDPDGEGGGGGGDGDAGDGDEGGDKGGTGEGGGGSDDVAALKRQLDEFRSNNRTLHRQLEEQKKKLDGLGDLSPDLIKAALSNLAKTEDDEEKAMLQKGDLEGVLARRMKKLRGDFETQLSARDKKLAAREAKLGDALLNDRIAKAIAAKKLTLNPGAMKFIESAARGVFRADLDRDDVVPREDDKVEGRTLSNWIDELVESDGYLFKGGGGGGGKGDGTGNVPATVKKSELTPDRMAQLAPDIASGKVKVIDG